MFTSRTALCAAVAFAALSASATAQSAGEWTLGFGAGYVMPKSDNGSLTPGDLDVTVSDNLRPTLTAEYFIMDNVGIEVLAALPFSHSVRLDGLGKVAEVVHLPPTVSLQYHFQATPELSPFVGVGVNYTWFMDVDTEGALDGFDLDLEDSWGFAAHLGFDYWMDERSALRADLRWIDIDTDAEVNGKDIGEVEIDPVVIGVSYIRKF